MTTSHAPLRPLAIALAALLLTTPFFAAHAEASGAKKAQRISQAQIDWLSTACWGASTAERGGGQVLYWGCGSTKAGAGLPGVQKKALAVDYAKDVKRYDAKVVRLVKHDLKTDLTQVCQGAACGQCVDFVRAMAGFTRTTKDWEQGDQVVKGGVARGTVIAAFVDGKYAGHTAIFWGYASADRTTIHVIDQNYVIQSSKEVAVGIVASHTIGPGTAKSEVVAQSAMYYVVKA